MRPIGLDGCRSRDRPYAIAPARRDVRRLQFAILYPNIEVLDLIARMVAQFSELKWRRERDSKPFVE